MQFMMTIQMDETAQPGEVPQALHEAMGEHIGRGFADGTLVSTGGLAPTAQSKRVRLAGGGVSVTDGPFTEAKEVIGGYTIMELPSLEAAVAAAREFVDLHLKHWPGCEMACDVRQIFGPEA